MKNNGKDPYAFEESSRGAAASSNNSGRHSKSAGGVSSSKRMYGQQQQQHVLGDENYPPGKENVDNKNNHGVDSPESKASALGKPKKNHHGNSPQRVKFLEQVSGEKLLPSLCFVVSETIVHSSLVTYQVDQTTRKLS